MFRRPKVIVVGAGIGGMSAAARLASAAGGEAEVTVLERARDVGGKMRTVTLGSSGIDAGPTVVTMRWVFDELFASCGAKLDDYVTLERAEILARHAWTDGTQLDLFADPARSADAIGRVFGEREAEAFRAFSADAERIYRTVEQPFLRSQAPTVQGMLKQVGVVGLGALTRIDAFRTMWSALRSRFTEPKLIQLFGRYATYCGSSPFDAPATLNLIAHVESQGVHRVRGGIRQLGAAVRRLAEEAGVAFRTGANVTRVLVEGGQVAGVELDDGELLRADAVVFNGDVSALGALVNRGDRRSRPAPTPAATPEEKRSLSAVTLAMVARVRDSDVSLIHHNVFFSDDYPAEMDALINRRSLPDQPTVYICAQDRGDDGGDAATAAAGERLLFVINAPPTGDDPSRWSAEEIERCERSAMNLLETCGLHLEPSRTEVTTPVDFERLFPKTGGALYGPIARGATSALSRQGARSRIPGLYLAGGSVHPGPGVPMAALSGARAAEAWIADNAKLVKTRPSPKSTSVVDRASIA